MVYIMLIAHGKDILLQYYTHNSIQTFTDISVLKCDPLDNCH